MWPGACTPAESLSGLSTGAKCALAIEPVICVLDVGKCSFCSATSSNSLLLAIHSDRDETMRIRRTPLAF